MEASEFCFLLSRNSLFWMTTNLTKFLPTTLSLVMGNSNKKWGKISRNTGRIRWARSCTQWKYTMKDAWGQSEKAPEHNQYEWREAEMHSWWNQWRKKEQTNELWIHSNWYQLTAKRTATAFKVKLSLIIRTNGFNIQHTEANDYITIWSLWK